MDLKRGGIDTPLSKEAKKISGAMVLRIYETLDEALGSYV